MGKYKICVYAICKNEAQFVDRWMDSMSEADRVVVLDTGSTDDSVYRLQKRGAFVTQLTIVPWRFDYARNASLALVPTDMDICVCVDLDEVFLPGWRALLEAAWQPDTVQASYRYVWNFRPDGTEGVVFWTEKIHKNGVFHWVNPVHEVLSYTGNTEYKMVEIPGMQLEHHADPTKSRAQYLPLLELAVQEDPHNDRNMHYLGREYMFHGNWNAAIATLLRHLAMPEAVWTDERCASMRFLARCFRELGNRETAKQWLHRAVAEAPHLREPFTEMAQLLYEEENWEGVLYFTGEAIQITERPHTYICEAEAWGALPYDLRSLALFYTGQYVEARNTVEKALQYASQDLRLQENYRLMAQAVERQEP
ncbi:MAG: tetratricopeptide repeat-containing glycosyltransferase [Oscillospiraceae bacterium]